MKENGLDELLTSQDGNNASDIAAVRVAIQNGIPPEDAVKYLVSSPELRAAILLDLISRGHFV